MWFYCMNLILEITCGALLLFPFYRWGNWSKDNVNTSPRVSQLMIGRMRMVTEPRQSALWPHVLTSCVLLPWEMLEAVLSIRNTVLSLYYKQLVLNISMHNVFLFELFSWGWDFISRSRILRCYGLNYICLRFICWNPGFLPSPMPQNVVLFGNSYYWCNKLDDVLLRGRVGP